MKKKVEKKNSGKVTKAKSLRSETPMKKDGEDHDKYRILVENSQEGSFILQEGKLTLANKTLARMTGYPGKGMNGLELKTLLAPEDAEFSEKVRRRRGRGDFDLRLLHRNGKTRLFVSMSLRRILYNGKAALLGVVRDRTELLKASEALGRSERRYREL